MNVETPCMASEIHLMTDLRVIFEKYIQRRHAWRLRFI
jgi:hypothetical protein